MFHCLSGNYTKLHVEREREREDETLLQLSMSLAPARVRERHGVVILRGREREEEFRGEETTACKQPRASSSNENAQRRGIYLRERIHGRKNILREEREPHLRRN